MASTMDVEKIDMSLGNIRNNDHFPTKGSNTSHPNRDIIYVYVDTKSRSLRIPNHKGSDISQPYRDVIYMYKSILNKEHFLTIYGLIVSQPYRGIMIYM